MNRLQNYNYPFSNIDGNYVYNHTFCYDCKAVFKKMNTFKLRETIHFI